MTTRRRRRLPPPPGLHDHVSRAEAAELLGYPSVFRIRALEREGRLTPARGVMGSAWYPRPQVLALRDAAAAPAPPPGRATPGRRRTDAELIVYLRAARQGTHMAGPTQRPATLADLVADTGVSIARAQKVYRFWLAHDVHPTAQQARAGRGPRAGTPPPVDPGTPPTMGAERRSPARLERAALIRQLREADPAIRAAAFTALKNREPPADVP